MSAAANVLTVPVTAVENIAVDASFCPECEEWMCRSCEHCACDRGSR